MANMKLSSMSGKWIKSAGFYIVKCACHTFRVTDSPELWNVINGLQRCWDCGRAWKATEVFGSKSAHKCGAKCIASKGPTCECSCGGENHGASYL